MNHHSSPIPTHRKIIFIGAACLVSAFLVHPTHATILKHGATVVARVTFYYPREDGSGSRAATGERLRPWHICAVDPRIIPYGSELSIPGIGTLLAHDTGTAVVNRKATWGYKRRMIVIDVCVRNAREMNRMAHEFPDIVEIRRL